MDGSLEIEGNLYHALNHFLGQMDKFSANESALKKLMFTSVAKKNQQREVQSHYDIGNDFYKLWLHYNRTLLCWEKNFREYIHEVQNKFDEPFVRMWDLYLSACAAAFHNGIINLHQILFTAGINNDLPSVRW